ncbi:hypothetical protein ACH5RR_001169 [Cinchona calisaya]|uniref:Uncharacterized protein n=1 Tax=Cinchona calisaya TaxID=153742 RepID=A0ABD3B2S9_9GENT
MVELMDRVIEVVKVVQNFVDKVGSFIGSYSEIVGIIGNGIELVMDRLAMLWKEDWFALREPNRIGWFTESKPNRISFDLCKASKGNGSLSMYPRSEVVRSLRTNIPQFTKCEMDIRNLSEWSDELLTLIDLVI